jgi:hypothetical protein
MSTRDVFDRLYCSCEVGYVEPDAAVHWAIQATLGQEKDTVCLRGDDKRIVEVKGLRTHVLGAHLKGCGPWDAVTDLRSTCLPIAVCPDPAQPG